MQGLELAERYWSQVGRPALAAACPEAAGRWAAGLVGEGSECFGCDDAISRDHDWGPGFCVWLTAEDHARWGRVLQDAYDRLPRRFEGFERVERPEGAGRVGVFEIGAFYRRFIGLDAPPRTVGQWMALDDEALATCTDGRVFEDGAGAFTAFREELLAFYPDDIRLKKLAARCALASQAGQYTSPRCAERGDAAAAFAALFRFIDNAQAAMFLLARRYRPYYKWANRAMAQLPAPAPELAGLIERMASGDPLAQAGLIEEASALLIGALRGAGLARSGGGGFLLACAREVQGAVHNDALRGLPLLVHTV